MNRLSTLMQFAGAAAQRHTGIWEIVLDQERHLQSKSTEEIFEHLHRVLSTMREAVKEGLAQQKKTFSGLSGGQARLLEMEENPLSGPLVHRAMINALATGECNAAMGRIVAAPTAGASGVLPGCLLALGEVRGINDEFLARGLLTAAGIGIAIAEVMGISGSEGGCQAEVGSAAGMAAGAITEVMGGSPEGAIHACALALKWLMGLVCDPVAGLVEVPCIKRNSGAAAIAFAAADSALSGIRSAIPPDEVLQAMKQVGLLMDDGLKESGKAGLCATPTARGLYRKLRG